MNRLTDQLRTVLHNAHGVASEFVGTEHLLMALAASPGVASAVLTDVGLTPDRLESVITPGDGGASGTIPFSPGAKRSLELALGEALAHHDDDIGTAHLLLALLGDGPTNAAARAVALVGHHRVDVRRAIDEALDAGASDRS